MKGFVDVHRLLLKMDLAYMIFEDTNRMFKAYERAFFLNLKGSKIPSAEKDNIPYSRLLQLNSNFRIAEKKATITIWK